MRKKYIAKKTIAALLALTMSFSVLTGCSKDTDSDNKDNDKKIEQEAKKEKAEKKKYDYKGLSFDEFTKQISIEMISTDISTVNSCLADPKAFGIEEIPTTLGTAGNDDVMELAKQAKAIYDQLSEYNYDELSASQKNTYDLLKFVCGLKKENLNYEYYYEPVGPTLGIQSQLPLAMCLFRFYNKEAIDQYMGMVASVGDFMDSLGQYETEKSKKGLFMSDEMADAVIEQCQTFISKDENLIVTNFNSRISEFEGISDEQKQEYMTQNEKLVKEVVIPSYERFIKTIQELKGSGNGTGTLASFEKGKEYYTILIQSNICTDKSVEEIADELESAITKNYAALTMIVMFNTDLLDNNMAALKSNLKDPEEILKLLEKNMQNDFEPLGEVTYSVEEIDESLQDFASPAMYFLPPIDAETKQQILINKKSTDSSEVFYTTMAHEGYPGHMYQFVTSVRNNDDPVRRLLAPDGLSEGYATYVEMKSYAYGDLSEKAAQLMQLNANIAYMVQARADIGVNYEGWTKEEVGDYFGKYIPLSDEQLDSVYLYMVESPSNTLSYVCGYLQYQELEDYAREQLGEKFDLKKFTSFIVNKGFIPFTTFKKLLDKEFIPAQ